MHIGHVVMTAGWLTLLAVAFWIVLTGKPVRVPGFLNRVRVRTDFYWSDLQTGILWDREGKELWFQVPMFALVFYLKPVQEQQDPVQQFLLECTYSNPSHAVDAATLWEAYLGWCAKNQQPIERPGTGNFLARLERYGIQRETVRSNMVYRGVSLNLKGLAAQASHLCGLLSEAQRYQMKRAQAISFAYGNVHMHNPAVTREGVAAEYDKLMKSKSRTSLFPPSAHENPTTAA